jgi:uncharacterized protein YbjT (DUF2867 family)
MNMLQTSHPTALVLGATGGIGIHIAQGLLARGWIVKALHRNAAAAAEKRPNLRWVQGDALNGADVERAAEGAEIIVHAVNRQATKTG